MHSHYDTLQVHPSADAAALRSAYRTLMRLYHPDVNMDAEALSRAREINAAYAVLSNPYKRAVYDTLLSSGRAPRLPQIRFGRDRFDPGHRWIARAAPLVLVAGVSVAAASWVAVWPELRVPSARHGFAPAVPHPKRTPLVAQAAMITPPSLRHVAPVGSPMMGDLVTGNHAPAPEIAAPSIPYARVQPAEPRADSIAASAVAPNAPAPTLESAPVRTARLACRTGAPAGGPCTNEEEARAELQATNLFTQSMTHADLQRQQLLLSARSRSAAARALCQSGDCVRDAYLQQFRDTVIIMEGGIPRP